MRENKFTISIKVISYKFNASFFIILYFYFFIYCFIKKPSFLNCSLKTVNIVELLKIKIFETEYF